MNRRITDTRLYQDFRDLAWIVLLADSLAIVLFVAAWHVIKNLAHSRW